MVQVLQKGDANAVKKKEAKWRMLSKKEILEKSDFLHDYYNK